MVMSVRQTKGSRCDLNWSTHALNEGVNLSGVLLCQHCQWDKPEPVMRNVTDLNAVKEERIIIYTQALSGFLSQRAAEPVNLLRDLCSSCSRTFL
jgi:hypothetical protein